MDILEASPEITIVSNTDTLLSTLESQLEINTISNTDTLLSTLESQLEINTISNTDTLLSTLESAPSIITLSDTSTVTIDVTDIGTQGIKGAKGDTGIGLNYTWSATSLGIKREDENVFVYSNLKGDTGNNLTFELLTETQKQELRGDVGDTATNYTNVFLASLLS